MWIVWLWFWWYTPVGLTGGIWLHCRFKINRYTPSNKMCCFLSKILYHLCHLQNIASANVVRGKTPTKCLIVREMGLLIKPHTLISPIWWWCRVLSAQSGTVIFQSKMCHLQNCLCSHYQTVMKPIPIYFVISPWFLAKKVYIQYFIIVFLCSLGQKCKLGKCHLQNLFLTSYHTFPW